MAITGPKCLALHSSNISEVFNKEHSNCVLAHDLEVHTCSTREGSGGGSGIAPVARVTHRVAESMSLLKKVTALHHQHHSAFACQGIVVPVGIANGFWVSIILH